MSNLKKILISVVVIVAILVAIAQFILQTRINSILNNVVAPEVKKNLDIDLTVKHARISMLGGPLNIANLQLGNPAGFTEPTMLSIENCRLNLRLLSLLDGILEISGAHVENSRMTFIRNDRNQINTIAVSQSAPATQEPDGTETTRKSTPNEQPRKKPQPPQPQTPLPNILIRNLSIKTMIEYIDHTTGEKPLCMGIIASLKIADLATFENPDADWGTIDINAHLDGHTDLFATSIKGKISPLIDPQKPSFSLDGTVIGIDLSQPRMAALCEQAGIKSDSASMEIKLLCVNGEYKKRQSEIVLTLKNCQPVGKLADKLPNFPVMPSLSVPIPVGGTFLEPEIDNPQQIFVNIILANFAQNSDVLMNIAGEKASKLDKKIQKALNDPDNKIRREIDKGLKQLNLEGVLENK